MTIRNDILIVADSRYELENIQALLKSHYGMVLKTSLEHEGVDLFRKHHPKLLILAYEEVEQAESFYLSIYEKDPLIHTAVHKTLLLCRGQQSELAYDLCFNGVMDDYVADRPLFDPNRLLLSVKNALDSYEQESKSLWFMQQIEKSQQDLVKLTALIQQHLYASNEVSEDIENQFDDYISQLKTDLRELERQISPLFGQEEKTLSDKWLSEAINTIENVSIVQRSESVKQSVTEMKEATNQLNRDASSILGSALKKTAIETGKIFLLIIDDDPIYLTIIESMLESDNFVIHTETDGPAGLKYLLRNDIDIILLDYLMPEMNGIEVLKALKSNPKLSMIPVIMLTGDASREVVASSIRNGAAEYVIKPGERQLLINKIKQLTANKN